MDAKDRLWEELLKEDQRKEDAKILQRGLEVLHSEEVHTADGQPGHARERLAKLLEVGFWALSQNAPGYRWEKAIVDTAFNACIAVLRDPNPDRARGGRDQT